MWRGPRRRTAFARRGVTTRSRARSAWIGVRRACVGWSSPPRSTTSGTARSSRFPVCPLRAGSCLLGQPTVGSRNAGGPHSRFRLSHTLVGADAGPSRAVDRRGDGTGAGRAPGDRGPRGRADVREHLPRPRRGDRRIEPRMEQGGAPGVGGGFAGPARGPQPGPAQGFGVRGQHPPQAGPVGEAQGFRGFAPGRRAHGRARAFCERDPGRVPRGRRRAAFRPAGGAERPSDGRAGLEALQGELARLTQQFSENVLDGTNAWQLVLDDESRLAGLPSHAKDRARADASAKGFGVPGRPCWRFTLHMPSQEPFMAFVHDGALRREMWRAAVSVGSDPPRDNAALVSKILALRAERSGLLGKDHFADLVLGRRMAKTGARALEFNEDFRRRCSAAFARECRELEEWKARETGRPAAPLAPWETAYWAERLRRARYDFDEEELRPYFPMDRVVAGLFEIVRRVFGIRIAERSRGEVETWHPEVEFFDVFDAGSRHIGSFYSDWHPRESKRGGAWMSALITGGPQPDGSRNPHLGLVCGNLTPPAPGRPALLSHREVETVFHEFGHLIHHLMGEVEIKSLSGGNVAWDFIELPSQIMENWCWEREGLDLFARHFKTGAPIPEPLYRKMTEARNFRSACKTMRQVAFAKMDLLLHMRAPEFAGEADLESRVRDSIADCLVPTDPPANSGARMCRR